MSTATTMIVESINWLRERYDRYRFFAERDIVWTLQCYLLERIESRGLPLVLFHDFPMAMGGERAAFADLVLLDADGLAEAVIDFKYEPSHARPDILPASLPVCFWDAAGVGGDVTHIRELTNSGRARAAFAVFLDEGGYFRDRAPHKGSEWIDWGPIGPAGSEVSVLWSEALQGRRR